jgi:hypothetical protein
MIQAGIGVGDSNVFDLGAIDPIAKKPAARTTLGIHPFPAETASATGGDTRDENFVAFVEYTLNHQAATISLVPID